MSDEINKITLDDLLKKEDGDYLSGEEFVALVQYVKDNKTKADLIDSKVGYVVRNKRIGVEYLDFYKSKEDAQSGSVDPIVSVPLPETTIDTDIYDVKLNNGSPSEFNVSSPNNVKVDLSFVSKRKGSFDPQPEYFPETGTLTLQRTQRIGDKDVVRTYTLTNSFMSVNDAAKTTRFDLTQYVEDGSQQFVITVTGNISNKRYAISIDVNLAQMELTFADNWYVPKTYTEGAVSTEKMSILYHISGSTSKHLNWELWNNEKTTKLAYGQETNIGTQQYLGDRYFSLDIDNPVAKGIAQSGNVIIKAWLSSNTGGIDSNIQENQIMVRNSQDDSLLFCINNENYPLVNWTSQKVFDWSVYKNDALLGTDIKIVVENTNTHEIIVEKTQKASNEIRYDFTPYLSANLLEGVFDCIIKVYNEDTLIISKEATIKNNNSYAPEPGADLIISPATRSNTESIEERQKIYNNASSGNYYTAAWTNVSFEQDGWVEENGEKCLKLFSGSKVEIDYSAYNLNPSTVGLTLMFDFKVSNITDEEKPVLTIGSYNNDIFRGFLMLGKSGIMYSSTKTVRYFQDVEWQEDTRTHIAVNIIPDHMVNGRPINLCRIFVNGVINREFEYNPNVDIFGSIEDKLIIGSNYADINIYSIYVYKGKISSKGVLNNYIASKSSIEEKNALIESNNILDNNNEIDYEKAKAKFNTLVWYGDYPSSMAESSFNGDLEVNIVGQPSHSGMLKKMTVKGQGTSAMNYYKFNSSYKFRSGSTVEGVIPGWYTKANDNDEEYTQYQGKYYQLHDNSPKATKLVGKINYASSMQSHKCGMTNAFNDLYKDVFNNTPNSNYEISSIMKQPEYENVRVAVEEEPFLFFVKTPNDEKPVFYCNMTWGSGKGDPATFGYSEDEDSPLHNYLMLEGASNASDLVKNIVPWFDDEVYYEDESYYYNGQVSWDYDLGNRSDVLVAKFKDALNYLYKYSTRIKTWNGTIANLKAAGASEDITYQYIIINSPIANENYKVMRYNKPTSEWVHGGITKTDGQYDEYDVNADLNLHLESQSLSSSQIINKIKEARIAVIRNTVNNGLNKHFNVYDILFNMCFCRFVGGSDNRAKNTYLYFDPLYNAGTGIIRAGQDDLDTVLKTNNQGQKQKPYWVEEHDKDNRPEFPKDFWSGEDNAMYNTIEEAYKDELRTMMYNIIQSMRNLGNGSASTFWDNYLFKIQKYFPKVAYNEVARLLYEEAFALPSPKPYRSDVDPLTQSLGDQLESEKEWMKLRIVYMASYCGYYNETGASFAMRSQNMSTITETPFMKLYMFRRQEDAVYGPNDGDKAMLVNKTIPTRTDKNQPVSFDIEGSGGTGALNYTELSEYITDLGDLSNVEINGAINFQNAKRLKKLTCGSSRNPKFSATEISGFPENLVEIDLRNIETLTSINSLSSLSKLNALYAEGTAITSVILPQTNNLINLTLPNTVNTLVLKNQKNLYEGNFSFDPVHLQKLTIGNVGIDEKQLIKDWVDYIGEISENNDYELFAENVNWTDFSAETLVVLSKFGQIDENNNFTGKCSIKGNIYFDSNEITVEQLSYITRDGSKLKELINNGELVLHYNNIITLTLEPTVFVGGYEYVSFRASGLSTNPITLNLGEGIDLLEEYETTGIVINGCYIYSGKIRTKNQTTISSVQVIDIRATDGTTISNKTLLTIRPVARFSEINISGPEFIETAFETKEYNVTLGPEGFSEKPTYHWYISDVRNKNVYVVGVDDTESYIKRLDNDERVVTIPNNNSSKLNLLMNALMEDTNNLPSFTLTCDVDGNYGTHLSANFDIVAHKEFIIYAVQCYDSRFPNYNPAAMIILNQKGVSLAQNDRVTMKEADSIKSISNWFATSKVTNTIGLTINGSVDTETEYILTDLDFLINFTGITNPLCTENAGAANFALGGGPSNLEYLTIPPKVNPVKATNQGNGNAGYGFMTRSTPIKRLILPIGFKMLNADYSGGGYREQQMFYCATPDEIVILDNTIVSNVSMDNKKPARGWIITRSATQQPDSNFTALKINAGVVDAFRIIKDCFGFFYTTGITAWKNKNTTVYIPDSVNHIDSNDINTYKWIDLFDAIHCAWSEFEPAYPYYKDNQRAYKSLYFDPTIHTSNTDIYGINTLRNIYNQYNNVIDFYIGIFHNVVMDTDANQTDYIVLPKKCKNFNTNMMPAINKVIMPSNYSEISGERASYYFDVSNDGFVLFHKNDPDQSVQFSEIVFISPKVTTLEIPEGITKSTTLTPRAWNKISFPETMTSLPTFTSSSYTCQEVHIPNSVPSMDIAGTIVNLYVGNGGGATLPITNNAAFTATNLYVRRPIEGTNRISGTNAHVSSLTKWNQCTGIAGYQHLYIGESNEEPISGSLDINFNIRDYFLYNNRDIVNVNVDNTVTLIGSYAFANMTSIKRVDISENVDLLSYTFYNSSIIFPNTKSALTKREVIGISYGAKLPYVLYTGGDVYYEANYNEHRNIILDNVVSYRKINEQWGQATILIKGAPPILVGGSYANRAQIYVGDITDKDRDAEIMTTFRSTSWSAVNIRSLYSYSQNVNNYKISLTSNNTSKGIVKAFDEAGNELVIDNGNVLGLHVGEKLRIKAIPVNGQFSSWSFAEDIYAEESYVDIFVPLTIKATFI